MEDKKIENHVHTMEHEIKLNGNTLKEIKKKIVNDVYDVSHEQAQSVLERTIENQDGLRSFKSSIVDGNSRIFGQIYLRADGNPMAEDEIKQFEEDWTNHWTPEMTEGYKNELIIIKDDEHDSKPCWYRRQERHLL